MHESLEFLVDAAANAAEQREVDARGPIQRKQRLVMRDPQQSSTISDFQLPDLPGLGYGHGHVDPAAETARVIEDAHATAQQMIAQTRKACEAEREAAMASGYEAGYATGMDAADNESAALISTAEQIGLHVAQERQRLLAEAEGEIVELAIAIAGKVVGAAVEVDESLVVEACRSAMRKAFQRETLVVRANPEDLAVLREAGPRLASELGGVKHLEFVEERRLPRGSLIVRTPAGEIDATFEGKAEKVADSLRELVRTRAAERRHRDAA